MTICFASAAATAEAPAGATASPFSAKQRSHWAYRPLERPALPAVARRESVRNPVDAFLLARLEAKALAPSPEADRRTLIRRATLDLHGVPPTPEEVEAFVRDGRPGAFERLIDGLLASPRYGERWARHWLDLVRYAESDGFKSDALRPGAWRYRDYVIRSLNDDKPYDRFVAEQLAGDEIAPQSPDALVATGFLRHWPFEDNGRTLPAMWQAALDDVTAVTGQVFLGLTVGCARCHDHKFDAISQKDYYGMQAFFAAMAPYDDLPAGSKEEVADYYAKLAAWEEATHELRTERDALEMPFHLKAQIAKGKQFPPEVQRILRKPPAERTPRERQIVLIGGKQLRVERKKMAGRMKGEVRKAWDALNERIGAFDALRPQKLPFARGVRDLGPIASPVRIADDPSSAEIVPAFLSVLAPGPAEIPPPSGAQTSGRRTALARWITDPKNPLTARVMVNRLWQHHFAAGLVVTSDDFGVQGTPPTHPRLLDWLAAEFVARNWSLKAMHRLMMTSAAYRQVSVREPDAAGFAADPANALLWRMNSRRVEAEVLRDCILATSGELNRAMFGEAVFPELPEGLSDRYTWEPTKDVNARKRRSIYLVVKRNTHLPLLETFDVPDNHGSCARRTVTTTPTQALVLLNDRWPIERARAFAGRLLRETGTDRRALIRRAYAIVFGRTPAAEELAAGEAFLRDTAGIIADRIAANEPVARPVNAPANTERTLGAALVDYCHALWNTNEFVYVD